MNIISSILAPNTYKYTLSDLIFNLMTSCRYMSKTDEENVKISTRSNRFHVLYLNGNNKICFCKTGSRAVYKTIYSR